jgi:predicted RNase H-like nuclease (RuvC/YqgF family)
MTKRKKLTHVARAAGSEGGEMSTWQCPDCGSVGTPYVAEIETLRARVKELKRENTALRWRITELAQTAEDLRHEVDEWKRVAKEEK